MNLKIIAKDYVKKLFLFSLLAMVVFMPFANQEKSFVSASEETAQAVNENETLAEKLDEILSHDSLEGTSTSVSIREADNGKLIYSHAGDLRLHPASNMKLLTGAAALETLGTDYQFFHKIADRR